MRRRRDIPPPPRPEGEPEIANARLLIRTGLWLAWKELRARLSLRRDPTAIKTKSYNEMALENAAAALRDEGQLDGYAYPPPPEPGVDYEEFDVPADVRQRMDARMAEVYVWSAREKGEAARRKRVRRRRLVSVGATAVLGLTGVAGASAVMGGATGIDVIDRVFGLLDRTVPRHAMPPAPIASKSKTGVEDYTTISVSIPLKDSPKERVGATAYEAGDGNVCIASALAYGPQHKSPSGGVECIIGPEITPALKRHLAFVTSTTGVNGGAVLIGLATPNARAVSVRGPAGALITDLSATWQPRFPGVGAFRLFIAGPQRMGNTMRASPSDDPLDHRNYTLLVQMQDGTQRRVTGSGG